MSLYNVLQMQARFGVLDSIQTILHRRHACMVWSQTTDAKPPPPVCSDPNDSTLEWSYIRGHPWRSLFFEVNGSNRCPSCVIWCRKEVFIIFKPLVLLDGSNDINSFHDCSLTLAWEIMQNKRRDHDIW